ncbi:hypothetical protein [Pseudomonas brassicacearum]|uniref:hypothetical protein n=1 Tax=Pseudomonas brassicacearum TaxID=930166 RepID=UPI00067D09BC|nr:hypothetical protein [Pseudomonas brassicacearum]
MQGRHSYTLNIRDLFAMSGGKLCGAEVIVAILDGDNEIDRLSLEGKVGPGGDGYNRSYIGKPGLKATIVSGPGEIRFECGVGAGVTPAA